MSKGLQIQKLARILWRWFLSPSRQIEERDKRRQAALLSAFLLGIIVLATVVELITIALIDWDNYTGYRQTIIGVSLLTITYFISRTRHTRLAAGLAVIIADVWCFFSGWVEPKGVLGGLFDFLILPLWLGSLYLSLTELITLIGLTWLGLLLFPLTTNAVTLDEILVGPFSFIFATSILLLFMTRHRDLLEEDRRKELSFLFENLQKTNQDLSKAYDSTIEGWSFALDLRDKETEGHTRRVTELTLELAKGFGFTEEELLHIRRGSLLHDIGKMGVPDRILLKETALEEEEWIRMKQHPIYAYEMLQPIEYLNKALDIPYCHHEKWDGTGYPRGLKGEEIPLAARIFAVVDVWDALTSDRPYRAAWTKEKALAYIKAESRKHFDPYVVEMFSRLIEKKNREQI